MNKWEVFITKGKTSIPKISITKGGQIGLNFAAYNKYKLGNYKYAVLMINKEEKKIGIKFTNNEKEPGAKKCRPIDNGGISLSAKRYIQEYGIDQGKNKRVECNWDEPEKMVIAQYK